MAKEFAKKFYNSKPWKQCREAYIAHRITIDGGMCERCHKRLGYIVHHRVKLTATNINDLDVALNHCNLEYECKVCHDEEHYKDMHGTDRVGTRCVFGPDGQPIERRDINENKE